MEAVDILSEKLSSLLIFICHTAVVTSLHAKNLPELK